MPIICLPLLIGGITWQEAAMQCVNLMAATLLGLSAGLLTTVCFRQSWASQSACLLLLAFVLLSPLLSFYHGHRDSPGTHSVESLWRKFEARNRSPMAPTPSFFNETGPLGLPSLAIPPKTGTPANPRFDRTWKAHLIRALMDSALLFALAPAVFLLQLNNERNPRRREDADNPDIAPMSRMESMFWGGFYMTILFLTFSGFAFRMELIWIIPLLAIPPFGILWAKAVKGAGGGKNGPQGRDAGSRPEAISVPNEPVLDTGQQSLQLPLMILGGICLFTYAMIAATPLPLFVLSLLYFAQWRDDDPGMSLHPGKERGAGSRRSEPIFSSFRRRPLQLPDGRNPCQELARAQAGGRASPWLLALPGGAFLLAILFSWSTGQADPYPLSILILIEIGVRWSLTAGILRQYDLARGGPLELALGSSLSDREVRQGLARSALRTHLWKPGLAALGHLILLLKDPGASLAGFHLASLFLIWIEARAIHMAGASLALRGYGRTAATLWLFGTFCLLPLATILLPPAILPLPPVALMDAALHLRLACALLGVLCIRDLRHIRRMVNDPDHRGITGLLFPRRTHAAQP